MEPFIATAVLTVAIVASFSAIGYALTVIVETRGYMESYARVEHAGILSIARKEEVRLDGVHSNSVAVAPLRLSISKEDSAVSLSHEIEGVEMVVYREKPIPTGRKLRPPSVVVFLKPSPSF
jgi:hypothetical protein